MPDVRRQVASRPGKHHRSTHMTEEAATSQPLAKRRFQFSIGSMLLWTAIVCLAVVNVMTHRELAQPKRELDIQRPLSAEEVARQFQKRTTLGPISVAVKDVRYSPKEDSYKIDFSWTDARTKKTWSSDVTLRADGYGAYHGEIRNGPFIKPLGYSERFVVSVETPSPLTN